MDCYQNNSASRSAAARCRLLCLLRAVGLAFAALIGALPAAHAFDVTIATSSANGSWTGNAWTPSAAGSTVAASEIQSKLATGDVTVTATDGDALTVSASVTWSANTLILSAGGEIALKAVQYGSGTAGLALEYGQNAVASGNGSTYAINAPVHLASTGSFSTKLGSDGTVKNYTVITSLGAAGSTTGTDLQGMQGNLGGNYVLGADIDASATSGWNGGAGFKSIGGVEDAVSNSNYYTGQFDGLGHVISGLTINRPSQYYLGLFGKANGGARMVHVGLRDVSIVGNTFVGGLVGLGQTATIEKSHVTGSVTGSDFVGGILGRDILPVSSVTLRNVWSSADVTGTVPGTGVNSWSGGVAGGLIGMGGRVYDSYATGNVRGGNQVGGLIGVGLASTINNAYFSGTVGIYSGTSIGVGGIMGTWVNGSIGAGINNVYWNTDTAGATGLAQGAASGTITNLTGRSTAQMRDAANFTGFTFTSTPGGSGWVLIGSDGTLNGSTGTVLPMLASEWSAGIANAHQLQLMAMDRTASYTLVRDIDAAATNAGANDVWLSSSYMPVGKTVAGFTGTLDGLGRAVTGLTVNRPALGDAGLFGQLEGTVRDLGLINGSVNGVRAGMVAGTALAVISKVYATGGSVTGNGTATGGLVGGLLGGSLQQSHADVSVQGMGSNGGLVGQLSATISNCYATGSVTTSSAPQSVGGLVGHQFGGSIDNSHSSGSVGGSGTKGGLIGSKTGGSVNASHWDTQTSGQASSAGGAGAVGKTTAQMKQLTTFSSAGWDIDDAGGTGKLWRIYDGHTYPLLRHFFTAGLTVTAHNASQPYSGIPYSGGNGVTYSVTPDARLLGTLGYGGTSQGAVATGSYSIAPTGLYAQQRGYDLTLVAGTLDILNSYTVAVTAGAGGGASCTPNPVSHGASTTCSATPNAGYTFAGWSGDCAGAGTATTCTLTNVTATRTVSASYTRIPVDARCGDAHDGIYYPGALGGQLCASGSVAELSGSGPWRWNCAGQYGGTSASCQADIPALIQGQCGSAHAQPSRNAPGAGLCASGSVSALNGSASGPWRWSCSGDNGGASASCNAPALPPEGQGQSRSYSASADGQTLLVLPGGNGAQLGQLSAERAGSTVTAQRDTQGRLQLQLDGAAHTLRLDPLADPAGLNLQLGTQASELTLDYNGQRLRLSVAAGQRAQLGFSRINLDGQTRSVLQLSAGSVRIDSTQGGLPLLGQGSLLLQAGDCTQANTLQATLGQGGQLQVGVHDCYLVLGQTQQASASPGPADARAGATASGTTTAPRLYAGEQAIWNTQGQLQQAWLGSADADQGWAGDPIALPGQPGLQLRQRVPKLDAAVARLGGQTLLQALQQRLQQSLGLQPQGMADAWGALLWSDARTRYRVAPVGRIELQPASTEDGLQLLSGNRLRLSHQGLVLTLAPAQDLGTLARLLQGLGGQLRVQEDGSYELQLPGSVVLPAWSEPQLSEPGGQHAGQAYWVDGAGRLQIRQDAPAGAAQGLQGR